MSRQEKNEVKSKEKRIKYCKICDVFKNELKGKVYHCSDCGVCIENWDHHCDIFGKCIAENNCNYLGVAVGLLVFTSIAIFVCNDIYSGSSHSS